MPYQGFVAYVGYVLGFLDEILRHLFVLNDGTVFKWSHDSLSNYGTNYPPSQTQWVLVGPVNLPDLTSKGEDIVAAIMTIVHNGLVALAQLSTLLPANALPE